MKKIKNKCSDCGKESAAKPHEILHKILCPKCSKKLEYITKSRAMKEYKLTEEDLDKLNYMSVKNPHYSSAKPMKLYLLDQVKVVLRSDKLDTLLKMLDE